ncbi:MAG TPA: inositol monophosphatase family protein, partial [Rickettsiales bacterium]|nr:inositol monophosphatase family protein [Rickettsiales bacterium]
MRNYKNLNLNYPQIIETIIASRDIILKHFTPNQESAFERKSDNSKVAKADLETNSHIINSLQKFYPEIAIISEENPQEDNIQALLQDKVFIIDPIDGTNSFVRGDAEFTVNIALKIKDKLVAGAIYLPIRDVVYYAENGNLFKIENATNLEQN